MKEQESGELGREEKYQSSKMQPTAAALLPPGSRYPVSHRQDNSGPLFAGAKAMVTETGGTAQSLFTS